MEEKKAKGEKEYFLVLLPARYNMFLEFRISMLD